MGLLRSACCVVALLAAAPAALAQTGESIAATVNDELITTYDVRQRALMLLAFSEAESTPEMMALAEEQALRSLIDEKLQLQEASNFELTVDDGTVETALASIAEQSGTSLEANLAELAAVGVQPETLREQIRAEIAWDRLVNGRYQNAVMVGSDQVDQAMEELLESLQEPQYRVAEIFFEINNVSDEATVIERVNGVIRQLQAGADFPALAQQYSDAPTASRGGDRGYQPLSQFPPEVAAELQRMQVERVAGPIRVAGGAYIVALIDKRDAASAEQLTLKAIVLPLDAEATDADREAARVRLGEAVGEGGSCDAADEIAARVDGAFVSDLGVLSGASLQPQVRQALAGVEPGGASPAIVSQLGAQVFLLCDRSVGGPGIPTRDQIESQIQAQRVSMLSRRYLRDLHREALIEIRGERTQ
jgi:peptidyl-prolyl cis-trans isomerase SurA